MDFGLNLITNGSGSVSSKQGAKTSRPKSKPKAGDIEVLDAGYQHHRPLKDVTPPTKPSQKLLDGPRADTPRLEAPKATPKTDFYVAPDGTTLPATGYRYMNSEYVEQTTKTMQAPGGYIGFSKFDSAKQVRNAYQISPNWSDAKLRGEFDTLQIFDNVRVPRAYGDKIGETLEPLTKVYPEFGTGGYPQLITDKAKNIRFRDVIIIGD
ncbi:hypothetical protein [Streptococcus ovis]